MSEPRGSRSFFSVRRRADRTMTLSQIVHLRAPSHEYTLRCMLSRTLILTTSAPDCLRTDPSTRVGSAMTRTAPFFFASPNRAVFSPDADDRHEACCAIGLDSGVGAMKMKDQISEREYQGRLESLLKSAFNTELQPLRSLETATKKRRALPGPRFLRDDVALKDGLVGSLRSKALALND